MWDQRAGGRSGGRLGGGQRLLGPGVTRGRVPSLRLGTHPISKVAERTARFVSHHGWSCGRSAAPAIQSSSGRTACERGYERSREGGGFDARAVRAAARRAAGSTTDTHACGAVRVLKECPLVPLLVAQRCAARMGSLGGSRRERGTREGGSHLVVHGHQCCRPRRSDLEGLVVGQPDRDLLKGLPRQDLHPELRAACGDRAREREREARGGHELVRRAR